jgi:glycosyltransferase involved in cell wall biosynthesis
VISVVIPCYNYGRFVSEAIDSCLGQDYDSFEVIVVNDGSTDSTLAVIQSYGTKVTCITQENKGKSIARNVGANAAQGDWLLFLDADDQLFEGAISALFACMENSNAGVIFGKTRQLRDNQLIARYNIQLEGRPPQPSKATFFDTLIITPGAAIVKKDVFNEVNGFKKDLVTSEDRHFWLKCGVTTSFKFCDKDIVFKRVHEDCISNSSRTNTNHVNRLVFNGYRAQLDFIQWCHIKGIDTSFINLTEAEIVERNINRAIFHNAWDAIWAIILHSKFRDVTSSKIVKSHNVIYLSWFLPSIMISYLLRRIYR